MAESVCSAMAREICESAEVASRIVRNRDAVADLSRRLDIGAAPLAVLCGRGSSGHAGVFLRYLIETLEPAASLLPGASFGHEQPRRDFVVYEGGRS